jgi:flagellar biosynthetic protein FliQ
MVDFGALARDGLWSILILSLAPLLVSLIVGLIISLFQALTQIQEQTLTFVPKVIAATLVIMLTFGWMVETMIELMKSIFENILKLNITS